MAETQEAQVIPDMLRFVRTIGGWEDGLEELKEEEEGSSR